MSELLLNWPYFHDLSLVGGAAPCLLFCFPALGCLLDFCTLRLVAPLAPATFLTPASLPSRIHTQIWSISNIFSAPGSPQRPPNERNNLAPPERAVPPPLPSGPSAWLYLNVLITQSQVGAAHAALWLGAVRAAGWWEGVSGCTSRASAVFPSVQLSAQPAHNLAFDSASLPPPLLPRSLCPSTRWPPPRSCAPSCGAPPAGRAASLSSWLTWRWRWLPSRRRTRRVGKGWARASIGGVGLQF